MRPSLVDVGCLSGTVQISDDVDFIGRIGAYLMPMSFVQFSFQMTPDLSVALSTSEMTPHTGACNGTDANFFGNRSRRYFTGADSMNAVMYMDDVDLIGRRLY